MSALATIVGGLGELSESELRQLYLMIGVRLGIPDVPAGSKPAGKRPGKTGKPGSSSGKSKKKDSSSKGNPQRKSQWANHPLYQEYSRLKKVVENQAKEAGTSFNSVDTPERRAYQQAFTQWVNAKSSFRDRSGHEEEGTDEDASEEKGAKAGGPKAPVTQTTSPRGGNTSTPKPTSGAAGPSGTSQQGSSTPAPAGSKASGKKKAGSK